MTFAFAPLSYTLPYWPEHLFGTPDFLDRVGISEFEIDSAPDSLAMSGKLNVLDKLEMKLPALDNVTVAVFPDATGGFTEIPWSVDLAPDFAVGLEDLVFELRVESELLRAVEKQGAEWVPLVDGENQPKPVAVRVSGASIKVSGDGDVDIESFTDIGMTAIAVGDTGIVVEILGVGLHLSGSNPPSPKAPPGFRGVVIDSIAVHLGDAFEGFGGPDTIGASDLFIGSSGFTGTIGASWSDPPTGRLFGLTFSPLSIAISFAQNKLTGMSFKGVMTLPFFDEPMNVTLGYDATGGLTIGIDSTGGILKLTKPGFLEIAVESLAVSVDDGKAKVAISGEITPLFGGGALDWPSFEVRELSIDSDGKVQLEGGWIDLPKQVALNFNAFTVQITKFGMGKKDNARWFGCSCTVNLIKGVQGKGSVEGLRIFLYDDGGVGFSFQGIAIEMKMAGAFDLKGSGRFIDEPGNKRFDGAAMLALKKPELAFDTQLTIGRKDDPVHGKFPYFGVYAGLELPFGITLGSLPFSLYGFALMFALHMKPGRKPDQPWYAIAPASGWYNDTPKGVALEKWAPKKDSKAIGLGVTLGTVGGGYPFNMKGLLIVSFPGIVILLKAMGNICKERKALASGDEPLFESIAILDFEEQEFTFGLDAYYKYDAASGGLVDIRGSAEAFFGKKSTPSWHLHVGKDTPVASRVHARIVSLFEANAYFMLDPSGIRTGAWVGYDKSWNLSPLSVTLQAWLDTNAAVSFKPPHFHADLWMHAAVELSAFGFGAGLSADALLAADVIDPFEIKGEMTVSLNLPKPLKDITKTLELHWGPRPKSPPVPIVLKGVGIEHLKSSAVWPLAVGQALVPDHDDGRGFLADPPPPAPPEPPPSAIDTVPMDAVISVAFARSVHDDAMVGDNAVVPSPDWDWIGDPANGLGPAKVRYALKGMRLEKWVAATSGWTAVAGKGLGAAGLPDLYGSWGAIPAGPAPGPIAQTNLMLWSKTAFHQNRLTGDAWNDWFAANHPHYPCVEAPPLTCYDFDEYPEARLVDAAGVAQDDIRHRDNDGLLFYTPGGWRVETLWQPVNGHSRMLTPIERGAAQFLSVGLDGPAPAYFLRIRLYGRAERFVSVFEVDEAGAVVNDGFYKTESDEIILSRERPIRGVMILMYAHGDREGWVGRLGVVEVCLGSGSADDQHRQALADNLKSSISHWADEDNVLEPHTRYRLVVDTQAHVIETNGPAAFRNQTSFAYFNTGGPPGLGGFTVPSGQTRDTIDGGPDNLANYVAQTIPATIGQGEDSPAMPRPVFRAYDLGVRFNANYPDLMYKMARRDLMLQVFDSNGEPARDGIGRVLTFENPWGVTSELELDDASVAWLAAVDPDCVPVDQSKIAHNKTIGTSATPLLLAPLTRYRARLAPLLLHEDFTAASYVDGAMATGSGARLGDWLVAELDAPALASRWIVRKSFSLNGIYLEQDNAQPGSAGASSDSPPGSGLVWAPATPPGWKRQRASAFVQAGSGGAVGMLFLYRGSGDYFAATLHSDGRCRLVRRTGAGSTKLAEAPSSFTVGTDSELVVEVSDSAIRIFVDGAAVLRHDLDLKAHPGGSVGFWCWNEGGARYKDLRVEDLSAGALASFGFEFVTSAYVNYAHLVQGRRTPVWDIETSGGDKDRDPAALAALSSAAVQQSDAPLSATEARQYEDLAALWLGPGLVRDPATPEVNLVLRGGEPLGWLIRSPEPWDWTRSVVSLQHSSREAPLSQLLGPMKIIGASLGTANGDDEHVDFLALDDVDLTGWRLQLRDASGAPAGLVESPFDDGASIWSDLHALSGRIGAGLRLRLHSGGSVQAPEDHTWRTMNIATAGDPGVARLPGVGADLRLLDRTGRTACAVRILPDSAFAPLQPAPRLLRKADSTGLVILPNSGHPIAAGAYRLEMVYRRDLSATDPETIILSQAGVTTDERAFLPLY